MNTYLESLIINGEGDRVEFLLHPESSFLIAKTICAFANTEGGHLLIGVRKNGKIAGTEPSESYSAVTNAISELCTPPVPFDSTIIQSAHKIVLEIIVPKSSEVHRIFTDNIPVPYIRFKNLSLEANSVLKKYLELKNDPEETVELPEEGNALLAVFAKNDFYTLTQLVKKTGLKREKAEFLLSRLLIFNKIEADLKENAIVYGLPKEV